MTDKARELLERAYQYIPMSSITSQEIRTYLAQSEQDEEPVAWTCQDELNALGTDVTCYMYAEPLVGETNIPLYLHHAPRPEFVRLSEDEVREILSSAHTPYEAICAAENRLERKNK